MRGGNSINIKKTKRRITKKKQKAGARSNYCLYSSRHLGTECSNWDGIVMLTKGLNPDEYLYKNLLMFNKKSVKIIGKGTTEKKSNLQSTIHIIQQALKYANDYLGIFKLSYFIKTVQASAMGFVGKDRDYNSIKFRFSPRGFWNGTEESKYDWRKSKFRNAELEDFKKISNALLDLGDDGITFSINDLSSEVAWFMRITNLDVDSDRWAKDSAEYICKHIKDKPINLTFTTTGGLLGGESEMKVMSIKSFINRTFAKGNVLKSQRDTLFSHISDKIVKFCGDNDFENSISEDGSSCKNSFKGEEKSFWKGGDSESRQPYVVQSIRVLYEHFRNKQYQYSSDISLTEQNPVENPIDYLTNNGKKREEYKLLSFDPFTNYNNISVMVDKSLNGKDLSYLKNLVFGSYVMKGSGNRGIIQLEEFNYKILKKNKKELLSNFMGNKPTDQLIDNISDFYKKNKDLRSKQYQIHEPAINHPLLIDHIIIEKGNDDGGASQFAIVTPYYHLLKISNRLEEKTGEEYGLGNKYYELLCKEYLKMILCKRFVGDILDMYIYKYKNTMTHPRISRDLVGDGSKKIDGVKSRTEQISTNAAISKSLEKGYDSGKSTGILGKDIPTDPSSLDLENFKKQLMELSYEELLEECKKLNIDTSSIESSVSDKEEKKKQLVTLLVDKIFPSGMDLSQMIRHNEFIMKNTSNPSEGFIRDNAYKNIDQTHEMKDGVLVSKRDISQERIIPDKTFIRSKRIEMKCPFCGNLSVDFTKSKSGENETVNPSNYNDGAYYYYCNNANCRAFLGAFYRKKGSNENENGKGQIEGPLNKILSEKLNTNFNFQDMDVYPNDGHVKNEINKMRQQLAQYQMQQYNRPDPQANSPYYQMQGISQMNPAQQMFTMDGAAQVGQQIGQSPPMQGMLGNINPFATTDTNAAMGMQSQIVHSPQGWNTTPYAQSGPGTENPVFTMGNYQVNAPGFGFDPNAQMGPSDPTNLTPGGTPIPMSGFGFDPNAQTGPTEPTNLTPGGTPVPMQGFGFDPNAPQMGGIFSNTGGIAPAGGFGGPMNQQFP